MPQPFARSILIALALALSSHANGEFLEPNTAMDGWDRGATEYSLYAEWDEFLNPAEPNEPDVGWFFGETPAPIDPPFDVSDTSGGSFVTSAGNLYSFSVEISPQIEIGGFGLGGGHTTTVWLQTRSLGSEVDASTVQITRDGFFPVAPRKIVELDRRPFPGFNADQVDTIFVFELVGSAPEYTINFTANAPSMSLERLAIDAMTWACSADADADSDVDGNDITLITNDIWDLNADTHADFFDVADMLNEAEIGCGDGERND